MKCHFVYSVPMQVENAFLARAQRKLRRILSDHGLPMGLLSNRQPSEMDFQRWPVQSPYENTRNLYCALSERMPTLLYDLTERVYCKFHADDIFLGHPYFPHLEGGYGVTEMSVKQKIRPRILALITPLHCDVEINTYHINKAFLDDVDKLLPSADMLFGIMGEFWWDQWDHSPYAHWKKKMIRLDMAVDTLRYPRIKKRFNRPGKRGYLYIGNSSDPRKGADFLSRMMAQLSDYPRGWIGSGPDIPNVPRIAQGTQLTPAFMSEVAEKYDIFISPSVADPNPTTILESMAWGFPVVCTPQSGYYQTSYRKNIYLDNIDQSVNVLRDMQYLEEAKLMLMADKARDVVVADYSWDKFTSSITNNIGL